MARSLPSASMAEVAMSKATAPKVLQCVAAYCSRCVCPLLVYITENNVPSGINTVSGAEATQNVCLRIIKTRGVIVGIQFLQQNTNFLDQD